MRKVSMAQRSRKRRISQAGYVVLVCYCVIFVIGIILGGIVSQTQEARVYQARARANVSVLSGVGFWREHDSSAPLGYVEHCSFRLGTISPGTTTLAFYVEHSYIRAQIDGITVYSVAPASNASLVSPGNIYATIAIDGNDSGRLVDVELVPTVAGVQNKAPTFEIGSFYGIYQQCLLRDLPQLLLSIISMVVGLVYIGIGLFNAARHRNRLDMMILGLFAVLLGVWKLLDTCYMSLIMSQSPRTVITFSLGALSMMPPLALGYFAYRLKSAPHRLLTGASAFAVACVIVVEAMLASGVAGVRQTLFITHISIVVTAVTLVYCMIRELRQVWMTRAMRAILIAGLVVAAGSVIDFTMFYFSDAYAVGSIAGLVAVLIYVLVDGIVNGTELSRRARTDAQTGAANRSACFDLLDDPDPLDAGVGFVMFDLNGLKEANDTQGHAAGDHLIARLSGALLHVVPRGAFVGRSGGDEFIVVMEGTKPERLDMLIAAVRSASVEDGQELSFSAGWAISYQGETMHELSGRADAAMYRQKEEFYRGDHDRRREDGEEASVPVRKPR